ncbi:His-Xaa-Ser system radical SAM maturase HxsB [Mailhella massiliensis]|uniref:His-Xaa-Ser system radical SAM maturase HxsB n=1 Tax=Mailhella massiliensis TaxID=1903261 RepID=UPI00097E05C5|nr:His-Xaa-Ser system radical SAM maturase HxsB [Mailhella massiliensis]
MSRYTLLPFQFCRTDRNDMLLVNECGDFLFLPDHVFECFIHHELQEEDEFFRRLKSHLFCAEEDLDTALQKIAARYRTRKSFLRDFTTLHMLVTTLRCNQRCSYCQVSCAEKEASRYDMDRETAFRAVDMMFQAPTKHPKLEFQGGEPLLHWDVVESTVAYAEQMAGRMGKEVSFVLCTNLTAATREQLEFCRDHDIVVSTSLDGDAFLHDACRKDRHGRGTYHVFMEKLTLARDILGKDRVGALMTTTSFSLHHLKDVVDEYVRLGMDGIFLRSLNPYGFAAEDAATLGYPMESFVENYLEALRYIMELNKTVFFPEHFATLLFSRILSPFATGFVDLQSPSGAGISGVIYDFDGSVFPSDEARMLARMGDRHFCLGNVKIDKYKDIFGSRLKKLTAGACLETTFPCAFCVYQAYCGTDPVRNYLETGSEQRNMTHAPFCIKHKGILAGLFDILRHAGDTARDIIWSWITGNADLVSRPC